MQKIFSPFSLVFCEKSNIQITAAVRLKKQWLQVQSPLDSGFLEVIKNFVSRLISFGSLKLARVGVFTQDQQMLQSAPSLLT